VRDRKEPGMDAEREQENGKGRSFAAGLVIGALVGAGMALLLAPQAGEDTRRILARRARRLADDAHDRYDDARRRVRRARELRREARDADEASGGG
jgi:gas vesicle protein